MHLTSRGKQTGDGETGDGQTGDGNRTCLTSLSARDHAAAPRAATLELPISRRFAWLCG